MPSGSAALEAALGYTFRDPALLVQALTHRSHGGAHYERLEYLGDGLINFVIGEATYQRWPKAPEGDLSRLRASLVCEDSLARIGKALSLSDHLRMGSGELKSGGYRRESILADALEALIGAIYLDGGFAAARETTLHLFAEALTTLYLEQGVTFDIGGEERAFPLDIMPRVIEQDAWTAIDSRNIKDLLERARRGEPVTLTLCGERVAQRFTNAPRGAVARAGRLIQHWLGHAPAWKTLDTL